MTVLKPGRNVWRVERAPRFAFFRDVAGCFGAMRSAMLQANRSITIVGWDGNPKEVEAVRDGLVSTLVVQNPFRMGYDGVNAAVEIIREGKTVQGGDTGVTFVTKDNVDDPEVKSVLDPTCEDPPL